MIFDIVEDFITIVHNELHVYTLCKGDLSALSDQRYFFKILLSFKILPQNSITSIYYILIPYTSFQIIRERERLI